MSSWAEVFSALPEYAFFEIVRHYLGPVSTPFHKPDLIDRLTVFLEAEDVKNKTLAYADPQDLRLLTCIAFRPGTGGDDLTLFFPDFKYAALREKILNLEERLLIWIPPGDNRRSYALTPLGELFLREGLLGPGAVLGDGAEMTPPEVQPWLDDTFLTAVLSFLRDRMPLFLREGGLRKRALEVFEQKFPGLFGGGDALERFTLIGRTLQTAGLILEDPYAPPPVPDIWRFWESLDRESRREGLLAAAVTGRKPEAKIIEALKFFTESLPEGRAFAADDLAFLFALAAGTEGVPEPGDAVRCVENLVLLGELCRTPEGLLGRTARNGVPDGAGEVSGRLTPSGDLTLFPNVNLSSDIALASELIQADVAVNFRLTKPAFLAGLDDGMNPERLFKALAVVTGQPVPVNLKTLASEWLHEYRSVRLSRAVVLEVEGFRLQLIEETGVLEPYCLSHPTEGLWLLEPGREEEWRTALETVGLDRLPPVLPESSGPVPTALPSGTDWMNRTVSPLAGASWRVPEDKDVPAEFEVLRRYSESVNLSQEERTAFEERLERRIILSPKQIRSGAWRFEVMSAKGLDYHGKLRLIQAALDGRDERLAVTVASGLELETVTILPRTLEKEGDEHILVGVSLLEEEPVRYKLRKIGFIKRIKAALF